MAPRFMRGNQSSRKPTPDLLEFDCSRRRGRPRKEDTIMDRSANDKTQHRTTKTTISKREHSSRTASDNDGDADVSDAEAEDVDEEDDDDDASTCDVLAPSGYTLKGNWNQAGLITQSHPRARKRRATSADLGSENETNPTKSLKRTAEDFSEEFESDDAVYENVALISESDENDDDIEKIEELDIMDSEVRSELFRMHSFTADVLGDRLESWSAFDNEDETILLHDRHKADITKYDYSSQGANEIPAASGRRVRFRTPMQDLSDASDINAPDVRVNDLFCSNQTPVRGDEPCAAYINQDHASSGGNSSGYETDYGDTTDEEAITRTTQPQAVLREPLLSSMVSDYQAVSSTSQQSPRNLVVQASRKSGPMVGTFQINPAKPCCMIDRDDQSMIFMPAKRPQTLDLPNRLGSNQNRTIGPGPVIACPTQPTNISADISHANDSVGQSLFDPTILQSNSSITIHTPEIVGKLRESWPIGPSVFAPKSSIMGIGPTFAKFTEVDDYDDDIDDGEDILNINDFVDFGADSGGEEDYNAVSEDPFADDDPIDDDDDDEEDAIARATLPTPSSTSPAVSAQQTSSGPRPLDRPTDELAIRFEHGDLGAFQHGQLEPEDGESEALSSLNARAIRDGRQSAANALLISDPNNEFTNTLRSRSSNAQKRKVRISRSNPIAAL